MSGKPLSIYLHIPFCTKKCPYCHFFVIPNKEDHRKQLLKSLLVEWQRLLPKITNHEIVSIYFGGGTPILLEPSAIQILLETFHETAKLSSPCEITIEANPENVTEALMKELKTAGINRVSIGVQSLQDDSLITLGRTHNSNKAIEAILNTHQSGISNISIDLMYELPNQTPESFSKTLNLLKTMPISHLSLYNLTIEPGTAFFKQNFNLPSPETNLAMLEMATTTLEKIGLHRYEISAFSKPGCESKHNTGYWEGRPFFGLGPSAFSYYGGKRFQNVKSLSRYSKALEADKSPVDFIEELPYPQNVHERFAVELRLLEGVNVEKYKMPKNTHEIIKRLTAEGYLKKEGGRIRLSEKGLLFYDTVATELI